MERVKDYNLSYNDTFGDLKMDSLRKGVTTGVLLVLAGSVMAMGGGKGMKHNMPIYDDFDLNGDGKIVELEFNEAHAKRMSEMAAEGRQMKHVGNFPGFAGIDTDKDGVISEEEFSVHQAGHRAEMQNMKSKNKTEKKD